MVVVADHEDMIKRLRSQNSTHHIQLGKMDLRQKMSGWSYFEIPNLRHDVKLNVNIFFLHHILLSKNIVKRTSWFIQVHIAHQLLAIFFNWLRIFGIPEKHYLFKLHVFWWRQRIFFCS